MTQSEDDELRERAGHRCEYCHVPQQLVAARLVIDHVIARQHGGGDGLDNLALCCGWCNLRKGPNLAGLDPETGQLTRLFNPREDVWAEHFSWAGEVLVGRSAIGRTTIRVLAINHLTRADARRQVLRTGAWRFD